MVFENDRPVSQDNSADYKEVAALAAFRVMEDQVKEGPPPPPKEAAADEKDKGGAKAPKFEVSGLQVKAEGDIGSVDIPDNWTMEPPKGAMETRGQSIAFHPKDVPGVRLVLNRTEANLAPSVEQAFKAIAAKPPHELTKEERDQIKDMLGNLADPAVFDMKNCRTVTLDGKNVLEIDGKFKTADREYKGYIWATQKSETQSVFMSAPSKEFENYKPKLDETFKSFNWREGVKPASRKAGADHQ